MPQTPCSRHPPPILWAFPASTRPRPPFRRGRRIAPSAIWWSPMEQLGDRKGSGMHKRVPFNAVQDCETTARGTSVAKAADGPCVSPTAVSHQLHPLDTSLSVAPGKRRNTQIRPASDVLIPAPHTVPGRREARGPKNGPVLSHRERINSCKGKRQDGRRTGDDHSGPAPRPVHPRCTDTPGRGCPNSAGTGLRAFLPGANVNAGQRRVPLAIAAYRFTDALPARQRQAQGTQDRSWKTQQ